MIKFMHIRDRGVHYHPCGGSTIAYEVMDDGTVEFVEAHPPKYVNFNRKIGRDVTSGRLIKGREGRRCFFHIQRIEVGEHTPIQAILEHLYA